MVKLRGIDTIYNSHFVSLFMFTSPFPIYQVLQFLRHSGFRTNRTALTKNASISSPSQTLSSGMMKGVTLHMDTYVNIVSYSMNSKFLIK